VTVQGETHTPPDVDRGAAEEQFNAIHAQHRTRVNKYIYFRLPLDRVHLADDFTQDVFLDLWRHLAAGKAVDYPFALLKVFAKRRVADFFTLKSNLYFEAVDFADPAAVRTFIGHRYASTDPDMALIASELEAAMETMREASQKWRNLHKKVYSAYQPLNDATRHLSDELATRFKNRLAQSTRERDEALASFQTACANVGNLRAELERAGGNWKSASNLPASIPTQATHEGSVASGADRTHCDHGHELHLENVYFKTDGTRDCRLCITARRERVNRKKGAAPAARNFLKPEVVAKARQLLADPAYARVSVADIAREAGLTWVSLSRHVPDYRDLRKAAKAARSAR
jgi:DNA-directed RNA polymerase specialized sigma24 family protein